MALTKPETSFSTRNERTTDRCSGLRERIRSTLESVLLPHGFGLNEKTSESRDDVFGIHLMHLDFQHVAFARHQLIQNRVHEEAQEEARDEAGNDHNGERLLCV